MSDTLTLEKPVALSDELRQAIAAADKAYEAALRPLHEAYAAALRPSDGEIEAVKIAYRDRFEALHTERALAIKAAYAREVLK